MDKAYQMLLILFSAIFLSLTESRAAVPQFPIRDYIWVDEDTSTGRMYVAMDSGILANEDSLISRLRGIAEKRSLDMGNGKPIKVALFSEERFAHPKKKVSKKDKQDWGKNYLADLDTQKNILLIYPALPAKKRKIDLGKDAK
jgi:hypothetical protein